VVNLVFNDELFGVKIDRNNRILSSEKLIKGPINFSLGEGYQNHMNSYRFGINYDKPRVYRPPSLNVLYGD